MRLLWAAVVIAVAAGTNSVAQEALTLTVRPSPEGLSDQARARQARLQRRMEEAEYLFRNICIRCGGGLDRPGAYAPFNPADALATPRR